VVYAGLLGGYLNFDHPIEGVEMDLPRSVTVRLTEQNIGSCKPRALTNNFMSIRQNLVLVSFICSL